MLGIIPALARWVKVEMVLEVIEGEALLWANAAGLKAVSAGVERTAKLQSEQVFGAVSVDEIPDVQPDERYEALKSGKTMVLLGGDASQLERRWCVHGARVPQITQNK